MIQAYEAVHMCYRDVRRYTCDTGIRGGTHVIQAYEAVHMCYRHHRWYTHDIGATGSTM